MKKVKLSILALLAIAAVAPSCKKGDEDPGLSLRSRKARVAGEWKVASHEDNSTSTMKTNMTSNNYTTTTVSTEKFDGGTYSNTNDWSTTQTWAANSSNMGSHLTKSVDTETGSVTSYTMTIEKDGTWKSVKEYVVTSNKYNETYFEVDYDWTTNTYPTTTTTSSGDSYTGTGFTQKVTYKEESEGTWQFLGKNKGAEEKNKESISLATTTTTTTSVTETTGTNATTTTNVNKNTFGHNENVMVMHITQLKNKEMIVDGVYDRTSGGSNTTGGTTTTSTDWTTKGTFKSTLTQE